MKHFTILQNWLFYQIKNISILNYESWNKIRLYVFFLLRQYKTSNQEQPNLKNISFSKYIEHKPQKLSFFYNSSFYKTLNEYKTTEKE